MEKKKFKIANERRWAKTDTQYARIKYSCFNIGRPNPVTANDCWKKEKLIVFVVFGIFLFWGFLFWYCIVIMFFSLEWKKFVSKGETEKTPCRVWTICSCSDFKKKEFFSGEDISLFSRGASYKCPNLDGLWRAGVICQVHYIVNVVAHGHKQVKEQFAST